MGLFESDAEPAYILVTVAQWPDDLRDAFEERAAIMEHDGGMTRAERAAFASFKVEAGL